MPDTDYTTTTQCWNGIEIEIRWTPDWLGYCNGTGTGHLEIRSINPDREPLPMTETGYRSHFIRPQIIEDAGGPDAYVALWLTQGAQTLEWRAADTARRQMSLF